MVFFILLVQVEDRSSDEICAQLGIIHPDLEYTDDDFQTLSNYKLFTQHVRPFIVKDNPRGVSQSKIASLMTAMWKEFLNQNPNKEVVPPVRKVRDGKYHILL